MSTPIEKLLRKEDLDELVKLSEGEESEKCEHFDVEDGYCLICGDNRIEDIMAKAFDRDKNRRKYGHE